MPSLISTMLCIRLSRSSTARVPSGLSARPPPPPSPCPCPLDDREASELADVDGVSPLAKCCCCCCWGADGREVNEDVVSARAYGGRELVWYAAGAADAGPLAAAACAVEYGGNGTELLDWARVRPGRGGASSGEGAAGRAEPSRGAPPDAAEGERPEDEVSRRRRAVMGTGAAALATGTGRSSGAAERGLLAGSSTGFCADRAGGGGIACCCW